MRGSSNVSRQIEHSSRLFKSWFWFDGGKLLAEAMVNEAGLVVFKKQLKMKLKWAALIEIVHRFFMCDVGTQGKKA